MQGDVKIHKGLSGVIADTSSVSRVMPEINSLVYRGYPVQELAEKCSFEEVACLLIDGELPDSRKLSAFECQERDLRHCGPGSAEVSDFFNPRAHPMDTLRTCISFLGMTPTEPAESLSQSHRLRAKSMELLAKLPVLIAAMLRSRKNLAPIAPDPGLGFCENFFHMCFGTLPTPAVLKAFEVSMILYAEHGFNASTFTARIITSTSSDIYSAVSGAVGALKGPLHGGANEAVMLMLQEIEKPEHALDWLLNALESRKKVMGFGHRVYRQGDSRVPVMKKFANILALEKQVMVYKEISQILEKEMRERKNIWPNLDFPAGPAYHLMGFDTDFFTPLFVMSRITGWCAHIIEQSEDNRIIRPLCHYEGSQERPVPFLANR